MQLFHCTSTRAASAIQADGFRDTEGSYGLATLTLRGVFVSDVPLDSNDFGGDDDVLLAIELDLTDDESADYELVEDMKPYREWCIPAAVLNARGRTRLVDSHDGLDMKAPAPGRGCG